MERGDRERAWRKRYGAMEMEEGEYRYMGIGRRKHGATRMGSRETSNGLLDCDGFIAMDTT